mmetsp:Transcript_3329/g.4680  ORF Transcript_3329/g.4680 Transcript_3329/m.4680 type:complete len:103 (+) Transcript_3329:54-362(+)
MPQLCPLAHRNNPSSSQASGNPSSPRSRSPSTHRSRTPKSQSMANFQGQTPSVNTMKHTPNPTPAPLTGALGTQHQSTQQTDQQNVTNMQLLDLVRELQREM